MMIANASTPSLWTPERAGIKTMGGEDIAQAIVRRHDAAAGQRGNWENQWEEISRRILPQYATTFNNQYYLQNQGQKRTEEMIDATGALALLKFAAAMESMLTPRGQTWAYLQAPDKTLMRNRVAREWYDDMNQALFRYRYAPNANYASQQHECYLSLGAFGSAAMFVDSLKGIGEKGLRYRQIHLGEIFFFLNHQGITNGASRKFSYTAQQAVGAFKDAVSDEIMVASKDPVKKDQPFWFLHAVMPREEVDPSYDPDRLNAKGMRYGSYYIDYSSKKMVREGGYRTFPYPISRYITAPSEVYGRSPAMLALPSLKTLNQEKKTILKQGHRAVDPVLLAHDDGAMDAFSMKPGAMNYGAVNAEGRPLVHTLPVGNLALGKEMMEEERKIINDTFLVTLFEILVETPQMTATEVLERIRQRGALLSPTMGRQQSEFLGPMIHREIDVLMMEGLAPTMPDIVRQAHGEYEAVYDSPLSRMQRAEQGVGLMNYLNWAKDIVAVTQDPAPLDWIDFDTASPELAMLQGTPSRWIKTDEMVAAVRKTRAQQMQQQQAVDAAPALAGVAKALPSLRLGGQIGAAA